jgi:hypothetical protein
MNVRTVTDAAFEFNLNDVDGVVKHSNAATSVGTIPAYRRLPCPVGSTITVAQYGEGALTIQGDGESVIRTPETRVLAKQYASATFVKVGTDEWLLAGYTTAAA